MIVRADIDGVDRVNADLDKRKRLGRPLRRGLTRMAVLLEGNIKKGMNVDRGRGRQSVTHVVDKSEIPRWAMVGSNLDYVRYQNDGTRPFFPNLGALQPWARRHGFPAGRRGAWLVAIVIARRGIRPRRFFERGLAASKTGINRIIDETSKMIAKL